MKEQRITIDIDESGAMHADAEGFSGDACVKELERLLEGLASRVEQIERKPQLPESSVIAPARITSGRKP